jgi:hypothetical protein
MGVLFFFFYVFLFDGGGGFFSFPTREGEEKGKRAIEFDSR